MKSKKSIIVIFSFVTISIIYLLLSQYYGRRRAIRQYENFYYADIYGKIENIEIKYHGTGFKILGDSNEYVFYPYTSALNNDRIIYYFAKPGDLIIKRSKSDTLILVKSQMEYKYTYQNFGERWITFPNNS